MTNPNPFRQVPIEDDRPLERSHSFFGDPKFEFTASRVDFKEPLVTSLPRSFSRRSHQKAAVTRKSRIERRHARVAWRRLVTVLGLLLMIGGAAWGFTKLDKEKFSLPLLQLTRKVTTGKLSPMAVEKPQVTARKLAQAAPMPQQAKPSETLYVTLPYLRVRTKPGLDGAIVRVMKAGDAVQAIGEVGNWFKLAENEYIGKRHLSTTKPSMPSSQPKAKEVTEKKAKLPAKKLVQARLKPAPKPALTADPLANLKHVALQSVKVRGAPGPTEQVVGILRKGTSVSVYEIQGVWARIGQNQFVHKGNLQPEGIAPTKYPFTDF